MVAALVGAGAGAGCRARPLGGEDASSGTGNLPDVRGDAGAATPDAGPTAPDAGTSRPDAGAEHPPVVCPTASPGRPGAPGDAASLPAACLSGPTAAPLDTVVPDGTNPPFRRCGTLGEIATRVTFSPDGRRLAVLAGEALHLYDTTGWREIARVVHSSEPINAAGFSPDGKRLATVSSHLGQLAVWNAEDGSLLRLTPSDPATSVAGVDPGAGVAFSSDGRSVASALGTVVDVETGATVSLQGRVRAGANVEMWFLPGDRTVAALTWYHSGDSWSGFVLEQFDAQSGSLLDSVGDDAALSADRSTVAGRAHWNQQLVVERLLPDGSRDRATYKNDAYAPFDSLKAVTAHGEALLVWVGGGIEARDAGDPTRTLSRVELPPGMAFVAMSPADEVVTAGPCGTVAWNWRTGAAVWAQPFAIRQIAWGAGGALASAVGPSAL